ncbi:PilW family protein [Photobacterium sanguinicancri]|uniref:Type II secretion system protein n=1 Tax=Photobacterium sanguinicancri TaxID=875932 RepID=A0AAW7YC59_9GAMM|nr:type II secretion system protein [Photobacterium sanguinicancri]MDO6544443.1 type II secretion system protein [Photobacterium sanguinicancri]
MKLSRGFTLLEMVISLVVLGVISLAVGSYFQLGVQGYTDTVNRDRAQTELRFAVEKITREVRHAAPNSVFLDSNTAGEANTCLSFYPVTQSGFYLRLPQGRSVDFILSGSDQESKALVTDINKQLSNYFLAIGFGSSSQYINGNKVTKAAADPAGHIELTTQDDLTVTSPANRAYLYREQVSYCYFQNKIYRFTGDKKPLAKYMPENLIAGGVSNMDISAQAPGLSRNGMIHISLSADVDGEVTSYDHTVQVLNVL